jgi:glycosyltransferase involved in cell wall biosynthesis
MNLLLLRDRISWFGAHTGYEQLPGFLGNGGGCPVIAPRPGPLARYAGSAYARLHGRTGRGATDLSELEFRWQRRLRGPQACHVLYMEQHLAMLGAWRKSPKDLIGTIHLPASVLTQEQRGWLSRLASALVLYQRDFSFFEKYVGRECVRFIHHGADTDFFKPDASQRPASARILYSGVYLRNEPMLVRVVKQLSGKIPDLRFDLLVPLHHRQSPALAPLLKHPSVTWHAGLNDHELRALYQRSHIMLLPMNDSGANTAVVEALASGLPVATTDVGGIRDYGGGSVFPVVANDHDEAMIALVERYISRPEWRAEVARRCRQFAEATLAWPLVAKRHLQAYQELTA